MSIFDPKAHAYANSRNFPEPCTILLDEATKSRTKESPQISRTFFLESRNIGMMPQYRIRQRKTHKNKLPDKHTKSNRLSQRAVGKIIDSAVHVQYRGGYNLFITLTLNNKSREELLNNKFRLQSEVTRVMSALKRLYFRGSKKLGFPEAENSLFDYIWVAESPKNTYKGENPHVHLVLRWKLCRDKQSKLHTYLTKCWKLGKVHLKKSDSPISTAAYLAKVCTQHDKDQGEIGGNRYSISRSARSPKWDIVGSFESHCYAQYIFNLYKQLKHETTPLYRERKKLALKKRQQRNTLKSSKPQLNADARKRIFAKLSAIQNNLDKVQKKIDAFPIQTNGYQITCSDSRILGSILDMRPLSEIPACKTTFGSASPTNAITSSTSKKLLHALHQRPYRIPAKRPMDRYHHLFSPTNIAPIFEYNLHSEPSSRRTHDFLVNRFQLNSTRFKLSFKHPKFSVKPIV
ncbi:hypothetical protein [uncultured Pseudoteredinibacter sp.]|uniref:hypothetical protein n=1 Tax=uncultured Pseudoteredinibacter sp. TaxID=1641701 RepID=UPI0026147DFE|nr:hypothetical protein [uncultured Pseudoteredinibacter sp.]